MTTTPTIEGLRTAWVEQQARERARRTRRADSITARDADGAAFDDWLRQVRWAAWEAAIDETAEQGTIQIPDNPYKETPCGG